MPGRRPCKVCIYPQINQVLVSESADTLTTDWGAIALGSLDIVLRAVACSPCVLASADGR